MGGNRMHQTDNSGQLVPEDGIQLISEMMKRFAEGASQYQVTFWAIYQLKRLVRASAASLFLVDDEKNRLVCVYCDNGAEINGLELRVDEGVAGYVFQNDKALIVPVASNNRHHQSEIDKHTGFSTQNMITAPISFGENRFGVVQLLNKTVNKLIEPFETEELALASATSQLITQAMMMIRLAETMIEDKLLHQELEQAKQLQALLLVQNQDSLPICGRTGPARHVGGDFYDYLISQGRLVFCLGDVAGKGMPAALMMGFCISAFRSFNWQENSLNQFVTMLNGLLCDLDSDRFLVMSIGSLELDTNQLTLLCCGHSESVLLSDSAQQTRWMKAVTPPLGIMEEFGDIPAYQFMLGENSWLVLMTDGVTEAFGVEMIKQRQGIVDFFATCKADNSASMLIDRLFSYLQDLPACAHDDRTALVIRR